MSLLAIIAIVIGVVIVVSFIGGVIVVRRRSRAHAGEFDARIAAADRALEAARAADRGWDRARLDEAARTAIEAAHPGFRYEALHLVLIDDRPGIAEDRAHMTAVGPDGELQLVLVRRGDEAWVAESVA